mgnify:CR=1 FL=1
MNLQGKSRTKFVATMFSRISKRYDLLNTLMTGAEFSGTNYAMALAFDIEQATDLVIADYNESLDFMENRNQSLLYETKALGDIYKARLGAVSEYAKAGGSLLSMANKHYEWL